MKEFSKNQQQEFIKHFFGDDNPYDYTHTEIGTWAELVHVLQK